MCTDCGQGLACVLVKVQLFGLRFHDGLCLPDVILHHAARQVQSAPHNVYVCVCVCLCVCNARRYLPRYPRSPHTLLPPCTPRHCPGWVQRRKPLAATDEHLATRGLRAYSHTRICMYAHTKLTRAPAPIHARTRVRTRARTYTCTHAWWMGWSRTAV